MDAVVVSERNHVMTDSSSVKEIAEEALSEAEGETQGIQSGETPNSPSEQTQEKTETFAEDVDPKTLESMTPQQLLEMKKNWERSYTQKRQKETAEIRQYQQRIAELEGIAQKADQLPQGDLQQRADLAEQRVNEGQMSVEEYTKYMRQLFAEDARRVAREEYQGIRAEEKEEQLAQKALEDFTSTDSRLNEHSPEFDELFAREVKREIAELLDQHLAQGGSYEGFDARSLTEQIVERKDRALDEIIKTRTQQSTQAAKMREAKAKKGQVRGTTLSSQQVGGNSLRSILEETLDGAA